MFANLFSPPNDIWPSIVGVFRVSVVVFLVGPVKVVYPYVIETSAAFNFCFAYLLCIYERVLI